MRVTSTKGAAGVVEGAARLAEGATASDLAEMAIGRMTAPDACPGAWAKLDIASLREQARLADARIAAGESLPLAGAVLAVKDVFDVKGEATRCGTALTSADPAAADSTIVALLREAGALVAGKTSMPEFSQGVTPGAVNPHDRARTPGSSSSGSAVAVADRQASFALGVQNNASVIRPASFCGVYAFKPSRGALSMGGVMSLTPSLDQPGYFAGGVEDLRRVHQVLSPGFEVPAESQPLAWTRTPMWSKASPAMREELEKLTASLGAVEIQVPERMAEALFSIEVVQCWELAESLAWLRGRENELTPTIREAVEKGRAYGRAAYERALSAMADLTDLARRFLSPWGGVLAPASVGAAPLLAEGSGAPLFSSLWSFVGAPCFSLPLLRDGDLPMGAQLIGAPGRDGELFRTAGMLG